MSESTVEVAARSLLQLPEPVRTRLLGPYGDGQGGLVAEVLDDVLRNVERPARAPFQQPEQWKALLRAMTRALGLALHQWRPVSSTPDELDRLRDWMGERIVSQQLLFLLLPHDHARWDVARLREEWQASALDAEQLGQADAEAWLRLLVVGFYRGVAEEPTLSEVIPLPALRQLVEGLGAQLTMPEEGDELTARSEYIRQLVHRIRQGEDLHEKLLAEIQELLKAAGSQGHVQQQALYQVAENALGRVGLARARDDEPRDTDRLGKVEMEVLADIRSVLEELRTRVETRPTRPDEGELAEMESLYRRHLRDTFEYLTFRGITDTGQAIRLPLEEVYVDLNIVAEVPEIPDDSSAADLRLPQAVDREGYLKAEQMRELDSLRYHRWREEARRGSSRLQRRVLDTSGTGLEQSAVVILGDPGSGKTTLLHYLALRAIRSHAVSEPPALGPVAPMGVRHRGRLPIFIPLAAYDDYVRNVDRGVTLEQFLALYHAQRRNLPGLEPLFHRALEDGRALILLDGLDEVLDLTMRRFVAQQVSGLLGRWVDRGNHFVLTSRFIGYREVALSGMVPHFMVLDLQPEQIQRFAYRWCEAFEQWAVGGRRSDVALQRARQQAQELLADVHSKPAVEHLASNPLLLTTLALLRRQVGQLPSRRIELYERYVRALLEHREVNRSEGARQQSLERLAPNIALQHLMDLALWLQSHRPSGTARERDMVRAMTEKALLREGKVPERATVREWEEAELRATRCLREVREIAGLIGERGNDAYGFLHLTFQEYLVGRALARESPEKRWELALPHLHDPRWREPLLICAGQLGVVEGREALVADWVERILKAGSEHEELLHRDLFLAAAIMADDVTRSETVLNELMGRLESVREAPVLAIRQQAWAGLARLVQLEHAPTQKRFLGHPEEKTEAFQEGARELREEHSEDDDAASEVRSAVARELGMLTGNDTAVHDSFLRLLEGKDASVRAAAKGTLSAIADGNPAVREALLRYLQVTDSGLRAAATQILSALAGSHAGVREALLLRLEDTDVWVRTAAVNALGSLAGSHAVVRDALLQSLEDEDFSVLYAAAEALGPLAGSDAAVYEVFLRDLEDPGSPLCYAAIDVLGPLAGSDMAVRKALLRCLEDADSPVRSEAAAQLGALAWNDAVVREEMLLRMESANSSARHAAVEVLGSLAGRDSAVREALVRRLEDEASQIRAAAAKVLAGRAGRDVTARRALLRRVEDTEPLVRTAVAKALGSLASDAAVCEALLKCLHDVDFLVRAAAAEAIGSLTDGSPVMRETLLPRLLQTLQEDPEGKVRNIAYHAALRLIVAPVKRAHVSTGVDSPKIMKTTASLLHLSDLHFSTMEEADVWYSQLAEDLRTELGCHQLDGAILSGDITNKSLQTGYDSALRFLEKLCQEFKVPHQRMVLVPGNHDLCRTTSESAYHPRKLKPGEQPPKEGLFIPVSEKYIEVPDEGEYKKRFERFARFYEQARGESYPLDYSEQGILYHFPELHLLVLGLNSAWNLDHYYTLRAGIHDRALIQPLERIRQEEQYRDCLKLAVWHHPLEGPGEDRIKEHSFLERLVARGFRLGLHGHIHKAETRLYRYGYDVAGRGMEIISAGTFGAPTHEWVSGYPLQYNLLQLQGTQLTVHTRRKEERNGTWKPDARWGDKAPKPYYTIHLD